jgi:steroid delta-isomerase-like uncharacterized protein
MSSPTTQTAPTAYTSNSADPVVQAAYRVFNARDFGALDSLCSDDTVLTNVATGQEYRGAAGVKEFMLGWLGPFPDGHIEIDTLAQAGDVAVCEFRGIGTHTGTLHTPMGDIPATGRGVNVAFCDVVRVRDGRITSIRTYFDSATFAAQLQG